MSSKFLILDRDGVIIEDKNYVHKVEDLQILSGAIDGLKKFRDAGYKFLVVTNQAGIARGIYAKNDMEKFHAKIKNKLVKAGLKIEKIYHCPHHPEFTGPCECRKPNTGMVVRASQEFGFSSADCIFIGDKDSDIELGRNCLGTTVLIENGQYPNNIQPDFKAKNISHAFDLLVSAKII